GGELNFAEVQADGDNILLKGTTIKLPTVSDRATPVGDITLENVQDTPEGGYSIEKVSVADMAFAPEGADKNDKATIKGISMENVVLPSEKAEGPLAKMVFYDKMKIDEFSVGTPGKD